MFFLSLVRKDRRAGGWWQAPLHRSSSCGPPCTALEQDLWQTPPRCGGAPTQRMTLFQAKTSEPSGTVASQSCQQDTTDLDPGHQDQQCFSASPLIEFCGFQERHWLHREGWTAHVQAALAGQRALANRGGLAFGGSRHLQTSESPDFEATLHRAVQSAPSSIPQGYFRSKIPVAQDPRGVTREFV